MAQGLSIPPPAQATFTSEPRPINASDSKERPLSLAGPSHYSPCFRTGHLNLDTFSPVNEHGSFEFDRVLKRGKVFGKIKSRHVSVTHAKDPSIIPIDDIELNLQKVPIDLNRHSKHPGNPAT